MLMLYYFETKTYDILTQVGDADYLVKYYYNLPGSGLVSAAILMNADSIANYFGAKSAWAAVPLYGFFLAELYSDYQILYEVFGFTLANHYGFRNWGFYLGRGASAFMNLSSLYLINQSVGLL